MNVIVVVDAHWGIGKNNDLLFRLPEDMKRFRKLTSGKTVVMGGNTLLSFPASKPLPNRNNIVLSDQFTRDDCTVVDTLDKMLATLKTVDSNQIFIVGGAMFYKTMLEYCDIAYITKVEADGDAEVFFPNLDQLPQWEVVDDGEPILDNNQTIRFVTYRNNKVKTL